MRRIVPAIPPLNLHKKDEDNRISGEIREIRFYLFGIAYGNIASGVLRYDGVTDGVTLGRHYISAI